VAKTSCLRAYTPGRPVPLFFVYSAPPPGGADPRRPVLGGIHSVQVVTFIRFVLGILPPALPVETGRHAPYQQDVRHASRPWIRRQEVRGANLGYMSNLTASVYRVVIIGTSPSLPEHWSPPPPLFYVCELMCSLAPCIYCMVQTHLFFAVSAKRATGYLILSVWRSSSDEHHTLRDFASLWRAH
jgi:hypothetical protein